MNDKTSSDVRQDQFLDVLSREDALARFESTLFPRPRRFEQRTLAAALGLEVSTCGTKADGSAF